MKEIKKASPLGRIMVAGLNNARHGREIMKESIQEAATEVVHELERFLTALGTIAAITPLLGLLGTVIGMIKVFAAIMAQGTGNASVLAGGISEALITTATGLAVAIPTLIFHRHLQRKVDTLVVDMEQEAIKLVEIVHGEREADQDK
jgi:biopolymer transport protein ExbB